MCRCVLLLVVLLVLYIFVIGGVAYVYMCDFLVDWMRLYFGFTCYFVYISIFVSCLVFLRILLCFMCSCFYIFVVGCSSSTPNEDIVGFKCGGSHKLFLHIFL